MPLIGEQLTIGGQGRGVDAMLPDSGGTSDLLELPPPGGFGAGAAGWVVDAAGVGVGICTAGVGIDGAPNPGIIGTTGATVGPAEPSPPAGVAVTLGGLVFGGAGTVAGTSTAAVVVRDGCGGAVLLDGCTAGPAGAVLICAGAVLAALDDGVDGGADAGRRVGADPAGLVIGAGAAGPPGTLDEAGHTR